jgi:hypothetical protein
VAVAGCCCCCFLLRHAAVSTHPSMPAHIGACCSLNLQAWRFMRERKDKDTPNAFHVYESVSRSIEASPNNRRSWGGWHGLVWLVGCAMHTPAINCCLSCLSRLQDNIKEEQLLQYIDQVLQLPLYDRDAGRQQHHHEHSHEQQQQEQPPT